MLNIYSASAGSGKTHKLTGEYLKLLFQVSTNDIRPYKHILAVTFTNKATAEMKQRILQELYLLSIDCAQSDFYEMIRSLKCVKDVEESDTRVKIAAEAKRLLHEILNDYSLFNISTIDKFFQQILRSFAREVGQYSSYNVELDRDSVMVEAIDLLMDSLEENDDLLRWMIDLSIEAIENGENWNVRNKIQLLGNELFSEKFRMRGKNLKDSMKDKGYILSYRSDLHNIVKNFESKLISYCSAADKILKDNSLEYSDFKGGSRSPFNYFNNIIHGAIAPPPDRLLSSVEDETERYSKSASISIIASINDAFDGGLTQVIANLDTLFNDYSNYLTAKSILSNLYSLGIIWDIYGYIVDYCKRKNIVLLSETTSFLNRIIDRDDTPFIYEKIGTRINHYMLDEFQDTSIMQWNNFQPLIKESLSWGRDNLIVGDVKQSIYRWRGSDWNLLNSMVYDEFDKGLINNFHLTTNWRSSKNIVEFNNQLFPQLSELLQNKYNSDFGIEDDTIVNIYKDVSQSIPNSKPVAQGHVNVTFFDNDQQGWVDKAKEKLLSTLNTLRENGYKNREIALLVRKNSEGMELADFLINNNVKIISDESLLISSSKSVGKIVSTLKCIVNPDDSLVRFFFNNGIVLPKETSLYSICEESVRLLDEEEKKDTAFIQAFLDCVSDYVSLNGSDIRGFLSWWDNVGVTRSISAPEGDDAIRIITIHKSKGLGFEVVIMPFFREEFYRERGDILWCVPSGEPFNKMGLIPIRSSSTLLNTTFAEDYKKEKLYSYVDAINICYVSFTRAKKELIIFSPMPKLRKDKGYTISKISDLLYHSLRDNLDEFNSYNIGEWSVAYHPNDTISTSNQSDFSFVSIPIGDRLKLALSGKEFFIEENIRGRGVIYHDILSKISIEEDLENAIKSCVSEGKLSNVDYLSIYNMLTEQLKLVRNRHWFDGSYRHLNEFTIIDKDGSLHRPDRVMISDNNVVIVDYKFGKLKEKKYNDQIGRYIHLIREMGYQSVTGYLWFFDDSTIEQVCV